MGYFDEADWAGHATLIDAGFRGVPAPHPLAVLRGKRCHLLPSPPPESDAWCRAAERAIYVASQADPRLYTARMSHELTHQGAYDLGLRAWDDDDLADEGSGCVLVPTWGIRPLVRSVGLVPDLLIAAYPLAPPWLVLVRAALVTESVVIIRSPGRRLVASCHFLDVNTSYPLERVMVRRVRLTGVPCADPLGITAWPFLDVGNVHAVAILADLRTFDRAM